MYRKTRDNPTGEQSVEVAFKVLDNDGLLKGWLVFQMDLEKLSRAYEQSIDDLKRYNFRPAADQRPARDQ